MVYCTIVLFSMSKEAMPVGHEATHASNSWLTKIKSQASRWLVNTALTAGGEFLVYLGSATTTLGALSTMATGNPIPLILGPLPAIIGSTIEWQTGMKHAGSTEKGIFWGAKAFATTAPLLAPSLASIASGMSAISGLAGTRHRK